jgi:hypothetical protein
MRGRKLAKERTGRKEVGSAEFCETKPTVISAFEKTSRRSDSHHGLCRSRGDLEMIGNFLNGGRLMGKVFEKTNILG